MYSAGCQNGGCCTRMSVGITGIDAPENEVEVHESNRTVKKWSELQSGWTYGCCVIHCRAPGSDKYLDMILGKVDMIVKKRRELQHDPGIFLSV